MSYASVPVSKIDYAFFLAASLAYFAQRQKDSVGLVTFDEAIVEKIPARCRQGHLARIIHALNEAQPKAQSEFTRPLNALAESLRRRGIVVLISDLLAPTEDIIRGLHQFRHKGHDVVVFHLVDPQEKAFAFTGPERLEDLETKQIISFTPDLGREEYLKRREEHVATLKKECGAMGIDYLQLDTVQPLDFALYKYLSTRRKSM